MLTSDRTDERCVVFDSSTSIDVESLVGIWSDKHLHTSVLKIAVENRRSPAVWRLLKSVKRVCLCVCVCVIQVLNVCM